MSGCAHYISARHVPPRLQWVGVQLLCLTELSLSWWCLCAEKVAQCLPGLQDTLVVEVNPGFGVLTRALLNAGARHIIALEHEKKSFLPAMKVGPLHVGVTH